MYCLIHGYKKLTIEMYLFAFLTEIYDINKNGNNQRVYNFFG